MLEEGRKPLCVDGADVRRVQPSGTRGAKSRNDGEPDIRCTIRSQVVRVNGTRKRKRKGFGA